MYYDGRKITDSGVHSLVDLITLKSIGKTIGGHLHEVIENEFGNKDGVLLGWDY
jgi:hypothetical protein